MERTKENIMIYEDKYFIITKQFVHVCICERIDKENYLEILHANIPTEEQIDNSTEEHLKEWIFKNNKLMENICAFLNSQKK